MSLCWKLRMLSELLWWIEEHRIFERILCFTLTCLIDWFTKNTLPLIISFKGEFYINQEMILQTSWELCTLLVLSIINLRIFQKFYLNCVLYFKCEKYRNTFYFILFRQNKYFLSENIYYIFIVVILTWSPHYLYTTHLYV